MILELGNSALRNPEAYIAAGHNGPYNDNDTIIRNYGHWIMIFSSLYKWTAKNSIKDKINELSEIFLSDRFQPNGKSYIHRNTPNQDKCNGLIGQAWTMETLGQLSQTLKEPYFSCIAENLFFAHNFNRKKGLWSGLEINGDILPIDVTFNHQLWFAACALQIQGPRREEIIEVVSLFLDKCLGNLTILENGIIFHPIKKELEMILHSNLKFKRIIKNPSNAFRSIIKLRKNSNYTKRMVYKSLGYHSFNMYAFGMISEILDNHPIWMSDEMSILKNCLVTKNYKVFLDDNIYSYDYNPPGYEVPYALETLSKLGSYSLLKECKWWIEKQLSRSYNSKRMIMETVNGDYLTHTARIYEATRLSSKILDLDLNFKVVN